MAEMDGFAVVCTHCKGTGKVHRTIEYDDFDGRQPREGIHTVIECNPGIGVGGDLNFGGQSYESWKSGNPFPSGSEMREFTCPAWWYQTCDYRRNPRWRECLLGGFFSECDHFANKAECWKRFEREQVAKGQP
jgi:hypothetical protein